MFFWRAYSCGLCFRGPSSCLVRMQQDSAKVTMGATCMKALAWSFLFCFIIMTIWSMLMVEFVYPCIEQMQQESGIFDDCEYCRKATSSVMHANLLLFKTVIAGDGWGHIAVPVLEAYPLTGFIFIGSLLTLVFGVLNLIVAAPQLEMINLPRCWTRACLFVTRLHDRFCN